MLSKLIILGAALSACVAGASEESTVVRDEPLPGNYGGDLRPQIHFSPPQQFMNDPNGMFLDADGLWHVYYQYNPTDIVAGNQHWGHATSKDLYHWDNQKIAIFPDKPGDAIFSGSAVVDVNNTSGFFPTQNNGVVAIYTKNTEKEQVQEIAYSIDGGYTFTKYANNPVISIGSNQFRDPKVLFHQPTKNWVMVVAYAQEYTIGIYTSPNLKEWSHASNFSHHGLLGIQYECPNMVTMPMEGSNDLMYLLAISINPGAPVGGSITQYFPGSFNGTHFEAVDGAARIADFGKDNYAGQFFYGIPDGEKQVSIGWASNWQYSQIVPTGSAEGWRSSMTLPRINYLKNITRLGYDMVSKPYKIETVYDQQLVKNDSCANSSIVVDYKNLQSGAIYFHMNVTGIPAANTTGTANFTFTAFESGESISGGFYFGGDTPFWINRGKISGFDNPFFTDKFATNNLLTDAGTWSMEGVIDRSILEIFLDGGDRSATNTFFPTKRLDRLEISTGDLNPGVQVSVHAWALKSAWAEKSDANGIVNGNRTMPAMSGGKVRRGRYVM